MALPLPLTALWPTAAQWPRNESQERPWGRAASEDAGAPRQTLAESRDRRRPAVAESSGRRRPRRVDGDVLTRRGAPGCHCTGRAEGRNAKAILLGVRIIRSARLSLLLCSILGWRRADTRNRSAHRVEAGSQNPANRSWPSAWVCVEDIPVDLLWAAPLFQLPVAGEGAGEDRPRVTHLLSVLAKLLGLQVRLVFYSQAQSHLLGQICLKLTQETLYPEHTSTRREHLLPLLLIVLPSRLELWWMHHWLPLDWLCLDWLRLNWLCLLGLL
mmetsp:Transcript_63675/g.138701  ORF Transcript_63675/g.138701 Transcript_63675/m.138701 type:complete len:271 (+) Transcript_63675:147-959(+)